MRALRLLTAFTIGMVLYQVAVVLVGGMLAAVAVPQTYFAWFGRSNNELALALLQLFSFALPIGLLVAGGTLSIHRLLGRDKQGSVLLATLCGLIACYLFWLSAGLTFVPSDLPVEPFTTSERLEHALLPPWWAVSGALGPWLGFSLAAWLVLRRAPGNA